jgi:hypothetical protein
MAHDLMTGLKHIHTDLDLFDYAADVAVFAAELNKNWIEQVEEMEEQPVLVDIETIVTKAMQNKMVNEPVADNCCMTVIRNFLPMN